MASPGLEAGVRSGASDQVLVPCRRLPVFDDAVDRDPLPPVAALLSLADA